MQIEYAYELKAGDCLQLDQPGNCAIEANTIDGLFFYLIIDTRLGWTRIMEYGPVNPLTEGMEDSCACSFDRFEWNTKKLTKAVDTFLNKNRNKIRIFQAKEVDRQYALSQCRSIIDFMKKEDVF